MTGFAKATAACGRAHRAFSTTFFLTLLTIAALLLIASPNEARAAGTCTINLGTVPYQSAQIEHIMSETVNPAEFAACDPRYPAVDSGVAPPRTGTSTGAGAYSADDEINYDYVRYTPATDWTGPDSFTIFFCNDPGCTFAGVLTATVNVVVGGETVNITNASVPNGTIGTLYSPQTFAATEGSGPYTFAVTGGALPAGLALSAAGVLSGTPTAAGNFNFTVTASDSTRGTGPLTGSKLFSMTVMQVTPVANPVSATVAYGSNANPITLNITGGAATSVAVGTQATNGTATASGTSITYTPNASYSGPDSFTYTATNSAGTSAPATVTITVLPQPPVAGAASATVGFNSTNNPITLNLSGGAASSVAVATNGTNGTATASGTSITYTPTSGYFGPDSFSYTATNAGGTSTPATVTITVNPAAPVANAVSTTVAYGSSVNPVTLNISGGPATSVAVATQATNGTATASGTTITYTPTAGYAGPDSFTYTATNVTGTSAPATVSITVSPPTLVLNPTSLPDGTFGVAYSQTTTASGGTPLYSYSISLGTLPDGLTIDANSGLISGTPTGLGTSTFTVQAVDSSTGPSAPFDITRPYSVTIAAPPITITSPAAGALPGATGGIAYSQTFTAGGGQGSHSFVASGTLPAGVTLSPTGTLSGTPTEAGTFNFTVTATDSSPTPGPFSSPPVAYSLTVVAPTITVSPATLPNATTALAYGETISATGGTGAHTFSVTTGTLPTGLNLLGGVLSGTPTAAGTSSFTITATDTLGFTGSRAYSITVADPVITITAPAAGALPSATGGIAYSQTFTASGGQGSHSFVVSGTLPAGVTLSPTGTLSGTPTVSGTFNFTVTATDSSPTPGPFSSTPVAFSLTVAAPTIVVSPTTLPNATTALAYSETITASGGTGSHTLSVSAGTLPIGLSLVGGVLSGTPTAAGTSSFTITATDALGFTGDRAYTITVANPVITITSPATGALPGATGGIAYTQTFTASGGQGSHTFALTAGATPPGVVLSPTGTLSGTPTASGTFNFSVTAADSSPAPGPFSSTPVAYSVTVVAPTITLSPATLPSGTTALAYTATSISSSGGTAPYSYAVTAGALPNGLNLNGSGTISGMPTATGTFNFTITATDTYGFTSSQAYSIIVADPIVTVTAPASGPLSNAEPGVAYAPVTFTASGGQGSHSFVVASGALPAGMTLSPGGTLSGTPTVTGTFNFSITASDSSPTPGPFTSAAVSYSLAVTDTLPPALVGMPANIVIEVDYPVTGAVATWTLPTASDNQPGTIVTQTAGLPSGATFPLGTTTNTYEARDAANNTVTGSFTVTVTQRLPGQVTMLVSTTTDGAFGFSSSEPALNFTVNTTAGSGTSGALTVPVGNHGITVTVPAGVAIASVSCTDPASSIDPATLSGTISVAAGAVISCTISSADPAQTTGLIGSFLKARSELILANEPDASRRIERLTGAYSGQGGVSGFGLGFTDERIPFALSLSENEASFGHSLRRSQAQGTADARIAAAHEMPIAPRGTMTSGADETAMPVAAFGDTAGPPAKPWPLETGPGATTGASEARDPMATPFDIWIEGKIARFDANRGDGRFGIMHAGVDYLVTPRILVGLGAQLDWTDMDGADDSSMSGTGYLVGPYVTARLTDNLFLDGRAAWGQSANDVSPFGTYTDKLDATRWLVSLALIGQYDIERWRLTPKAKLAYFEEETEAYVDGLGLDIPAISISTGTLEFGPSLSYRMELSNGMLFEPFATLEGIWTFRQDNTATAATSTPGLAETGLRGRGELGFRLAGQSASSLSSSIFYDGLGNDDFQSWGGKLRFNHRF